MKVTKIVTYCEFKPISSTTEHCLYFTFEDGSTVKVDGVTRWPNELFEKLEAVTQHTDEELAILAGWHRYVQAFTP